MKRKVITSAIIVGVYVTGTTVAKYMISKKMEEMVNKMIIEKEVKRLQKEAIEQKESKA